MSADESHESKSFIERIPWKTYLKSILIKLGLIIIMAILFLLIVYYSSKITPDLFAEDNPDNVIGFNSSTYILLIIISSTLFLLVLGSFIKTLFFDHKDEFGINDYTSTKTVILGILIVSFISAVYVLLDVALRNVYLTTGPVDVIWILDNNFNLDIPTITSSTNRLAYAHIRSFYFIGFYIIMLIFPVIIFFILLTRFGRSKLFKEEPEEFGKKKSHLEEKAFNALGIIFAPFLVLFLISVMITSNLGGFTGNVLAISILGIAVWWIYQVIMLFIKGLKLGAFFSYANIILFFPIIFLFYILPVLLWTGWDLFKIYSMNGSTIETAFTELHTTLDNSVIDIAHLSLDGFINLVIQSLTINAVYVLRIIQLDFVFIIGVSAIAIGFAEGYAIISIFRALLKGASIAKTGRVASKSAPKMVVMASRLVMIGAWLTFFWDRIIITIDVIKEEFVVYFPWILNIHIPRFFSFVFDFKFDIDLGFVILPLALLGIPLYYVFISAFKFLSVGLIVDKAKGDAQVFYLLISSAFVLITTNILQDIQATSLKNYGVSEEQFLPMVLLGDKQKVFFSFANKLFESMESFAFYVGVLFAFGLLLRSILKKYVFKDYKPSYM